MDQRSKWLVGLAAAALLLAAFGGLAAYTYSHRDRVPDLLAQAYTDGRPFAWRLPDHGYAPVQTQRQKPAVLVEAQALLARKLEGVREPGPAMLAQRAWADLLDANPDSAIRSLEAARKDDPDNPTLLSLLGTAYAVRADAGQAASFQTAIEYYTRVLRQDPANGLALFNRALAYSKTGASAAALADCGQFEKLAVGEAWSNEMARLREHVAAQGKP